MGNCFGAGRAPEDTDSKINCKKLDMDSSIQEIKRLKAKLARKTKNIEKLPGMARQIVQAEKHGVPYNIGGEQEHNKISLKF